MRSSKNPQQINPVFLFFPDSAPVDTSLQPRRRRQSLLSFLSILSSIRQAAHCLSHTAVHTSVATTQLSLSVYANFARLQVLSRSRRVQLEGNQTGGTGNMQSTQEALLQQWRASQERGLYCVAVKEIRCCKRVECGCQGGVRCGAAGSEKNKVWFRS